MALGDTLLSTSQAALLYHVTPRTMRRWVADAGLHDYGLRWPRYTWADIDDAVHTHHQSAVA